MKKKKSFVKRGLLVIIILVVLAGFYINFTIFTPVDSSNTDDISIVINRGSSVGNISTLLKDEGLIQSRIGFYGYVRLTGLDKDITAGRFLLNKSMNVPAILEVITVPSASESVVTVQEGLTISDIDDKLVDPELITDGEFEQAVKDFDDYSSYEFIDRETVSSLEFPLEGYLYPDTYFVDGLEFESEELIIKMLNNFKKKYDEFVPLYNAQERSMHDVITMASILQKEVRTEEDFETVAGILWKRLDSGWHIGADATILYATKKKQVEVSDIEFDSPYNTRLHVGMPPGPISNPDIEHIKAVLTPEDSAYWYYLTTLDTGEVIYAATNDEHNANKAKYLY